MIVLHSSHLCCWQLLIIKEVSRDVSIVISCFSFKCSRNPHEPIQCHRLRQWLKKCDDDSETSHWIHCNTKVRGRRRRRRRRRGGGEEEEGRGGGEREEEGRGLCYVYRLAGNVYGELKFCALRF